MSWRMIGSLHDCSELHEVWICKTVHSCTQMAAAATSKLAVYKQSLIRIIVPPSIVLLRIVSKRWSIPTLTLKPNPTPTPKAMWSHLAVLAPPKIEWERRRGPTQHRRSFCNLLGGGGGGNASTTGLLIRAKNGGGEPTQSHRAICPFRRSVRARRAGLRVFGLGLRAWG